MSSSWPCADDERLRVEVVDHSERLPALQTPEVDAPGGRGLLIIEALAERWGVDSRATGKAVWFEVLLDAAAQKRLRTAPARLRAHRTSCPCVGLGWHQSQRPGGVMSAKWRRCQKCRKVLSADEFDADSDVCRSDLQKATAPVKATPRAASTVTTRVVAPPAPTQAGGVPGLRGRGDMEVRARRARVRALERLAEMHSVDFDLLLREERTTEGL